MDAWVREYDERALLLTLYGEGRGESIEGRIAVGCVIRNRAKAGMLGRTITDVCLWPKQFSCWNDGADSNHVHLMAVVAALRDGGVPPFTALEQAVYDETAWVVQGVVSGMIRDRVHGSTHYYAPAAMVPRGRVPVWARLPDGNERTPTTIVGGQRFFAGIR